MSSGSVSSTADGSSPDYRGRFAPTPSGPLHLGSLLAAVASYLDARASRGRWHLRIDDLDTPRVVAGADAAILRTLEAHGLEWDGPVLRQSEREPAYREALQRLFEAGLCYYCTCSRKRLAGRTVYPGTCRGQRDPVPEAAIRLRTTGQVAFDDRVQGRYAADVETSTGDFVVFRRDGIAAYQLAVVVDDDATAISHVVRGADLLDNTPRQIYLYRCLGLEPPTYAHVPVILEASGAKLSKHTRATHVDDRHAGQNLVTVLQLLGQPEPPGRRVAEVLEFAAAHWDPARIPRQPAIEGFVSL